MDANVDRRRFLVAGASFLAVAGAASEAEALSPPIALNTVDDLRQAAVPGHISAVDVQGFYEPGDLGAARYVRISDDQASEASVQSADGTNWVVAATVLTPEMFGAKADGKTDSTAALKNALSFGFPVQLSSGTYVITNTIMVNRSGLQSSVSLAGNGMGKTFIKMNFFGTGIYVIGNIASSASVTLENFTLYRTNASEYPIIGPQAIIVHTANNVLVSGVEEWGAIGMGIILSRCGAFTVTGCNVHNHKSGAAVCSGTDGIHFDMCAGPGNVLNNRVSYVGDDGISFGSYSAAYPMTNVKCFNNTLINVAGSIKVFGNTSNISIYNNSCTGCFNGGITLWDDENEANSFDITNVLIQNNKIVNCGGPAASAGIYISQPTGNGTQKISGINIVGNQISGCTRGVSVYSAVSTKVSENITIQNNTITSPKCEGVLIQGVKGPITISGNTFLNTGRGAIVFDPIVGSGNYSIANNTISGYCMAMDGTCRAGIWIQYSRQSGFYYTIKGNTITNKNENKNATSYWAIYGNNAESDFSIASNSIDNTGSRTIYVSAP